MLMQMASHHRGSTGVRLKMADASEFVGRNSDNREKAVQAPLVALFRTLKAIIAMVSRWRQCRQLWASALLIPNSALQL